jgi:hypothetical protein
MKRSDNKMSRGTKGSKALVKGVLEERRIPTPNPDLAVMRIGKAIKKVKVSPGEQASGVLARVAKVMNKPGANRAGIFKSVSGRPVFAYFVYAKDPTKVVREDVTGRQTVGKIVGGRFRSAGSPSTD